MRHLFRLCMGSLGLVFLGLFSVQFTLAGEGWIPQTTVDDSDTDDGQLGAITDTFGPFTAWSRTENDHDMTTTAEIGSRWFGEQYEHAHEQPEPDPEKTTTSDHRWYRDGGTQYKYLSVEEQSENKASGVARRLNDNDPEWWFSPDSVVTSFAPRFYWQVAGQWVQSGFDWYDEGNNDATATATMGPDPMEPNNPYQKVAQAGGSSGYFKMEKELDNVHNYCRILFSYKTVPDGDVDNARLPYSGATGGVRCYLSVQCKTAVSNTP